MEKMTKFNLKSSKTSVKQIKCEICPKTGIYPCPNCNLVHYCSQYHQLKHKNDPNDPHGADCQPIKVVRGDPDKSEFKLVTTREIQAGVVIFREKPLFLGPGSDMYMVDFPSRLVTKNEIIFVCLGCYRAVFNKYRCTKCNWPVCDHFCQMNPWHKDFECNIFAQRNVIFTPEKRYTYLLVSLLRFLMLEKKDPETWYKMLPVFEYCISVSNAIDPSVVDMGRFGKFVQFATTTLCADFNLDDFELDYSKMMGIILVLKNYGISSDNSTNMVATAVFDMGMNISTDCTPNTFPKLDRVHGNGEIQLSVYSLAPLEVGSQLTRITDAGLSTHGTYKRRTHMMLYDHIICSCQRCCDPTEFGSFFTTYKCLEPECYGSLMAVDPLEVPRPKVWKCSSDKCPIGSYSVDDDMYKNRLRKFDQEIAQVTQEMGKLWIRPAEEKLELVESLCATFKLDSPHNYLRTWDLRHNVCNQLEMALNSVGINPKLKVQIAKRILRMTTPLLHVANKICPGLTPARAKLIYLIYKASRAIMEETKNPDPFMQSLVERMGLEALRIMKTSCPPSLFCGWIHLRMFRELECSTQADSYEGISLLFSEQ